jgi:NACHT domain
MAVSKHHLQRMEVDWFPFVALWKPYVALRTHHTDISDGIFFDSIAGSGKTVIWFVVTDHSHHVKLTQSNSSTIIEDIMVLRDAGRASVAYFYFDFRDTNKRSYQDLLHSLLIQLSAQSNHSFDTLSRLHSKYDRGTRLPSDDAMMECLREMLSTDQNSTYIIIDALDECPNTSGITSPRGHVLNLLKKLVELSLSNLYVCVTSRPETDIRPVLESLTQKRLSLHSENGQITDIFLYICFVVLSDEAMRRWKEEDKILAIKILFENEGGM